jgi:hypothetical protein
MSANEFANDVAELCQQRRLLEAMDLLAHRRELRSKAAVCAKNSDWLEASEVHRADFTGPFASLERFPLVFDVDWTRRATGERLRMQEVAVYTVENGQIVREEFLYGPMQ